MQYPINMHIIDAFIARASQPVEVVVVVVVEEWTAGAVPNQDAYNI